MRVKFVGLFAPLACALFVLTTAEVAGSQEKTVESPTEMAGRNVVRMKVDEKQARQTNPNFSLDGKHIAFESTL